MKNILKRLSISRDKKSKTTYFPLDKKVVKAYNNFRPEGKQKYLCMAPFRSLYFGHFGKVSVCCYNRSYTIGTYPDQSIKEIWYGENLGVLRDYIKHNDLSLGCKGCYHHLNAGNFDAAKPHDFDALKKNSAGFPASMEFELSNTCNLECIMCNGNFSSSIRKNREKKPPIKSNYDASFVDQLEEFIPYLEQASFYGGEPFLVDIYYEIWERIADMNPDINIMVQTNATILNQRVKKLLDRARFNINISIDSLQKENYEYIRKNARFEKVMGNLEYFRSYCSKKKTNFFISACAMPQNWHELPDFIHFCNRLNTQVYFHQVIGPEKNALGMLSVSELEKVYHGLSAHDFPANTPIEKKNKEHYEGLVQQIKYWWERAYSWQKEATLVRPARIKTIQDLHKHLEEVVNGLEIKDKKQKIEIMDQKLLQLTDIMGADTDIEQLTGHLDWEDPIIVMHIIKTLIELPVSSILELAEKKAEEK